MLVDVPFYAELAFPFTQSSFPQSCSGHRVFRRRSPAFCCPVVLRNWGRARVCDVPFYTFTQIADAHPGVRESVAVSAY